MADQNSDVKAIQDAIQADAPKLAALLDSTNASIALSTLGKALLGDAEAPAVQIAAIIASADKLKIQAAEQEAQLRLRQNDGGSLDDLVALAREQTLQEKNRLDDTERARQKQVESHDSTNKYLAYWVSIAFFILLLALIALNLFPPGMRDGNGKPIVLDSPYKEILFTLLGVVATGWANIIGFYFGTSAGSAQKSQTINAALLRSTAKSADGGAS
jgi:hypothetical protein